MDVMKIEKLKKKRFLKLCFYTMLTAVILLLLYLIYKYTGFGFKCIFYEITGLKCAGCGITHALGSLLKLEFKEALLYNPLFPVFIFYIGFVFTFSAKKYLHDGNFSYISPNKCFDIFILILIVLWTLLRNLLGI